MSASLYTTEQIIHNLTTSYTAGLAPGLVRSFAGTAPITFAINAGVPTNFTPLSYDIAGIRAMTPVASAAAANAFRTWDDLVARSLVQSTSSAANINLNYTSSTGGQTYERSATSAGANGTLTIDGAQVWMATSVVSSLDAYLGLGGYGATAMMHEIGHALGLSHPGTYNSVGSTSAITYANNAEFTQDNRQFTIMSYFGSYNVFDSTGGHWETEGSNTFYVFPQTPMVYDVAAIQSLYGADMTTRIGNTVYGYNCSLPTSDSLTPIYNFAVNTRPIFTIWDAAGFDTLDCSGYAGAQSINLTPGAYSSVRGLNNNVGIAFGAYIERAIGGAGADSFTGPSGSTFTGGLGNDTFNVTAGTVTITDLGQSDVMVVSRGAMVTATAGYDWVATAATQLLGTASIMSANHNIDASRAVVVPPLGFNINALSNTVGVSLVGSTGIDCIFGGRGSDTITGGAGSDAMMGGQGSDTFVFNSRVGSDNVTDFVAGVDRLAVSQSVLRVGNGNLVIDNAATCAVAGGFHASSELVIFSTPIAAILPTMAQVLASIGNSLESYTTGQTAVFEVSTSNGVTYGADQVYLFTSSGNDNIVSASELTQLVLLMGARPTLASDFLFVA